MRFSLWRSEAPYLTSKGSANDTRRGFVGGHVTQWINLGAGQRNGVSIRFTKCLRKLPMPQRESDAIKEARVNIAA